MGYDSRVYAIQRTEIEGRNGHRFAIGCEVARFEVFSWPYSGMDDEWLKLFTVPVDYDLPDEGADGYRADCYGVECTAADVSTVKDWIIDFLIAPHECDDTRAQAFLCWLEGVEGSGIASNLQLVQWGH